MYKLSKDYTQYLSVRSVNMSRGLALHKTALELNQPFLNVCMKETMDNMVFFSNLMCIVIKITENFLYLHN